VLGKAQLPLSLPFNSHFLVLVCEKQTTTGDGFDKRLGAEAGNSELLRQITLSARSTSYVLLLFLNQS